MLQATALALIGSKYLKRLIPDPKDFVRRGAKAARVEVHLSNTANPVTLELSASGRVKCSLEHSRVLLLGYGATRLLPKAGMPPDKSERYAKVDNLFDPFVPVADPEHWLLSLPKREFDACSRALKHLFLQLDGPERLVRRKNQILVETRGGTVPLRQLSDGYQSVIGITADVMRIVTRYWQAMEVAEGLVIIDELGAHLHPRWRMRVVTGLRHAFPRIQFIASTHDPLCLRGLDDNEVVVLRQDPSGRTYAVTDLPPVSGMPVEQLLASEHFGLHSTIDPDVDAAFTRYYDLKAKRSRSEAEEGELAAAKAILDRKKVLGKDRRERLMLEAIDGLIAREDAAEIDGDGAASKAETIKSVQEIWMSELPME